jgi:hypothetical protein
VGESRPESVCNVSLSLCANSISWSYSESNREVSGRSMNAYRRWRHVAIASARNKSSSRSFDTCMLSATYCHTAYCNALASLAERTGKQQTGRSPRLRVKCGRFKQAPADRGQKSLQRNQKHMIGATRGENVKKCRSHSLGLRHSSICSACDTAQPALSRTHVSTGF